MLLFISVDFMMSKLVGSSQRSGELFKGTIACAAQRCVSRSPVGESSQSALVGQLGLGRDSSIYRRKTHHKTLHYD